MRRGRFLLVLRSKMRLPLQEHALQAGHRICLLASKNRPVGRLIGFSLHHLLENAMRPVIFNIFFRFFDYLHFLCQSFFRQPVYFATDLADVLPVMRDTDNGSRKAA